MHENHETMVMRAGYGKFTGFIFGLLGLIIMIYALPNLGWVSGSEPCFTA